MILFLTYHKVASGSEKQREFYTTNAEDFENQLELLTQSGLQPLPPAALTQAEAPTLAGARHSYLLSFDDGTEDHHRIVLPLLERYHCPAIFFVPTAKLNRPGYLTQEAVRDLNAAGHVIGLHGHEHQRLDELMEEDIRVQFEISQNILGELTGARPLWFAPPGGYLDRRVRAMAAEAGVRATRTMRWGYNRKVCRAALQCIPLNRHITQTQFQRILNFQRSNYLYSVKQAAKKFIPGRFYDHLRDLFFRTTL